MSSNRSALEKVCAETVKLEGAGNELVIDADTVGEEGTDKGSCTQVVFSAREECSGEPTHEPTHLSYFYFDNMALLSHQSDKNRTRNLSVLVNHSRPKHEATSLNLDDRSCSQFIDNDEEYDQMEEEEIQVEEKGSVQENDPLANQFLHIDIPATGLMDVSRVKKDLHHDRTHKKKGVIGGLQRAVSSVKISDRGRSFCQTRNSSTPSSSAQEHGLLQRHRESNAQKPSLERQGLLGVGRVLSMKKREGDRSVDSHSDTNAGLAHGIRDRPRNRAPEQQVKKERGGVSLHQVGRSLSSARRNASNSDENSNRDRKKLLECHTENIPVENKRTSLQRITRAISFSSKTWKKKDVPALKQRATSVSVTLRGEDLENPVPGMDNALREGSSKATVTTKGTDAVSASEFSKPESLRGRERNNRDTYNNSKVRGEARLKVKAVGRMFSFSKQHANISRTVLRSNEQVKQSCATRTQSAPPRAPRHPNNAVTHVHTGGRVTNWYYAEITSEQVKRSRQLQGQTHLTVPIIALSDYAGPGSRSRWHTDVFVLPHNAVRMECLDLYDILVSIAQSRRETEVSVDDMNKFEEWWVTACDLFKFYFEVERRILFPWVESADSEDWDVQIALKKMRGMKHKLQEHLTSIERVWNEKTFKTEGEMFALVYQAVNNFVPRLMNYFSDQEVLLPAIVKGFYKAEERVRVDREIAMLVTGEEARKNMSSANHRLVLLIRWMTSAKQVRAWTGRNLNSWARNMYPKWYSSFQSQHLSIVKSFRGRCNYTISDQFASK